MTMMTTSAFSWRPLTNFTLREYVHKLQLLKSPEERQRRIAEIPVVHDDPKMNPAYESEEDVRSADNSRKGKFSVLLLLSNSYFISRITFFSKYAILSTGDL